MGALGISDEEWAEIAEDEASHKACRHRWRMAGSMVEPPDPHEGTPERVRYVSRCLGCLWETWTRPMERRR